MKNSSWLLIGFPISLKKSGESAVVVSLSGEATYHPASGENVAIQEGSVLATSGILELGPNSNVTLFYDGKRHVLDTEGRHDLSQTLQRSGGSMKLKGGFAEKFEKQLIMAFADDDDKGGAIGWGARSILPVTPVDTTVGEGEVLFLWADRSGPSDAAYDFQLFRAGIDALIMEATVQEKKLTVDLSAFEPEEGEKFYWTVISGDEQSEKAYFTFSREDRGVSKTLQKVRDEKVYREADEMEQLLMEAVALKEADLVHQAFQKLHQAASKSPGNRLVEGMMKNFVAQMR
jgi:hypothetical protein